MSDKCPVDHSKLPKDHPFLSKDNATEAACPVNHESRKAFIENCSSERMDVESGNASASNSIPGLSNEREVSSIPRADTGKNWIYPSESQFFKAMKNKNFDPQVQDMKPIIPIHNAVNERVWRQILQWEDGKNTTCLGPELVRFEGDASKVTPKARFNMFVNGWTKPFDRHDWLIRRCDGTEIEYVIDFYTGSSKYTDLPSFYIDARPKLNSFEGVKMRLESLFK